MISTAVESFGSLDILVNNAGVTKDKPIAIDVRGRLGSGTGYQSQGCILCTKFAAKQMIKQNTDESSILPQLPEDTVIGDRPTIPHPRQV